MILQPWNLQNVHKKPHWDLTFANIYENHCTFSSYKHGFKPIFGFFVFFAWDNSWVSVLDVYTYTIFVTYFYKWINFRYSPSLSVVGNGSKADNCLTVTHKWDMKA